MNELAELRDFILKPSTRPSEKAHALSLLDKLKKKIKINSWAKITNDPATWPPENINVTIFYKSVLSGSIKWIGYRNGAQIYLAGSGTPVNATHWIDSGVPI